jgi:hypothetical protein
MNLAGDLESLHEAYERNIWSLDGICPLVPGTTLSTEDYIRWLKSKVDFVPQVFVGVNENFVSVAIEGVLEMARGGSSIDLEDLRRVTASCGMDILPRARDAKKVERMITQYWCCPFGYMVALSTTKVKLH